MSWEKSHRENQNLNKTPDVQEKKHPEKGSET